MVQSERLLRLCGYRIDLKIVDAQNFFFCYTSVRTAGYKSIRQENENLVEEKK